MNIPQGPYTYQDFANVPSVGPSCRGSNEQHHHLEDLVFTKTTASVQNIEWVHIKVWVLPCLPNETLAGSFH